MPSTLIHDRQNDRLLWYFRAYYLLEDLEFDFDRRISAFSLSWMNWTSFFTLISLWRSISESNCSPAPSSKWSRPKLYRFLIAFSIPSYVINWDRNPSFGFTIGRLSKNMVRFEWGQSRSNSHFDPIRPDDTKYLNQKVTLDIFLRCFSAVRRACSRWNWYFDPIWPHARHFLGLNWPERFRLEVK